MCLAVPALLHSVAGSSAKADFGGVSREISIVLVPEAKDGDYVLIHAGFAIALIEKKEAEETLRVFKEIYESSGI